MVCNSTRRLERLPPLWSSTPKKGDCSFRETLLLPGSYRSAVTCADPTVVGAGDGEMAALVAAIVSLVANQLLSGGCAGGDGEDRGAPRGLADPTDAQLLKVANELGDVRCGERAALGRGEAFTRQVAIVVNRLAKFLAVCRLCSREDFLMRQPLQFCGDSFWYGG